MKVLISHARAGQEKHFNLTGLSLLAAIIVLFCIGASIGAVLYQQLKDTWLTPSPRTLPSTFTQLNRESAFMRENINLLAARLGILQAKLVGVENISRKMARLTGVERMDLKTAASHSTPAQASQVMDELFTDRQPFGSEEFSAEKLGRQLDEIQARLAYQIDASKVLDTKLALQATKTANIPTSMPLSHYPALSSSYGWRRHPITGRFTMHEGLDFAAPLGTPIYAVSAGIIVEAKYNGGYGNMVEIDHGDSLMTRYAHASTLLVKQGDIVGRGQVLGYVGSSGHSTGPHLHFEVRLGGQSIDPTLFLEAPKLANTLIAHATMDKKARQ